jgi:hydroxymethylpyrimidine pyrophosphatase-like HAD family hydrolase
MLFAVDVDGTLLDSTHRLRTDVKDSVCRLAASGLEIALATARGPAAVREIVRHFDFSPWLICFSGGWIGELELPSLQPKDVRLAWDFYDHFCKNKAGGGTIGK